MSGKIHSYLAEDHERLDALLRHAAARPDSIDLASYGEFRAGLLRHISMEEKILFPAAQRAGGGGKPLPVAAKLRLDHGALAALLVPTPTRSIIAAIGAILKEHNRVEEDEGGVYEQCERLVGDDADRLVATLRNAPEVRLASYNDGPNVIAATKRALSMAGYDFEI